MKNVIITLLIILFTLSIKSFSQSKKSTISFNEEVHQFGTIKEEDGPVTCEFEVTNTGGEPLIINNVKASCGCTSPEWSKTPIAPGKSGSVKATYNPKNRPGKFNKSLTVLSNSETPTKVLRIQGVVIARPKTIADLFPHQMGDLRLKSNHLAFVKIKSNEKKTDSLLVINDGFVDMKITFDRVPNHITIKAKPEIIKPKQKALIVASYDASLNKNAKGEQEWGFMINRVNLIINDDNNQRNRLSISASIKEDFSVLTEKEIADAAIIKFDNTVFNFGKIKQGESVTHEYTFKNEGKNDLIIRKIKASCGCTATNPADKIIKGGKTSSIKTIFNSRGKKGKQNKTITVITNDPKNSTIILKITGEVEIPGSLPKTN